MTLYRVVWYSIATGKVGSGEPLPKNIAELWAAKGNEEYPNIAHVAVEVLDEGESIEEEE